MALGNTLILKQPVEGRIRWCRNVLVFKVEHVSNYRHGSATVQTAIWQCLCSLHYGSATVHCNTGYRKILIFKSFAFWVPTFFSLSPSPFPQIWKIGFLNFHQWVFPLRWHFLTLVKHLRHCVILTLLLLTKEILFYYKKLFKLLPNKNLIQHRKQVF